MSLAELYNKADYKDKSGMLFNDDCMNILSQIDNESIETLDEKDGLFNPVKVDDVRNFDKISKEEMEARAIENGLLIKASKNATEIIEKLINNDVVQEQGYVINFKTIE